MTTWGRLCLLTVILLALVTGAPASVLASAPAPDGRAPLPSPSGDVAYEPPKLEDGAPAPEPPAGAWLLGDVESGEVLASHNPDTPLATASVMKLLTGLALEPELEDREQKIRVTDAMAAVDGTKVGLLPGNDYTVDQLFHAMLMSSANDAAYALGEAVGGQDKALDLMAEKAAEIGLEETTPRTTSGLDADGQVSSVSDLMILAGRVLDDDYLMRVIKTETYDFPGGKDANGAKQPGYQIQNHTQIVGEVEGGLGLKNGYTTKALGSYVAVAERDGRTLVSSVLNSQADTRDVAVDLLDWGFAQSNPKALGDVQMTPPPSPTPEATSAAPPTGRAANRGWALEPAPLAFAGAVVVLLGVLVGLKARRGVPRRKRRTPAHKRGR